MDLVGDSSHLCSIPGGYSRCVTSKDVFSIFSDMFKKNVSHLTNPGFFISSILVYLWSHVYVGLYNSKLPSKWSNQSDLQQVRDCVAEMCLSRNLILVPGGWIGKGLSSVVCLGRTFDGAMRNGPPSCWISLAPMRHIRKRFKFCYFRKRVRAAGGMTGKILTILEAFIHFQGLVRRPVDSTHLDALWNVFIGSFLLEQHFRGCRSVFIVANLCYDLIGSTKSSVTGWWRLSRSRILKCKQLTKELAIFTRNNFPQQEQVL